MQFVSFNAVIFFIFNYNIVVCLEFISATGEEEVKCEAFTYNVTCCNRNEFRCSDGACIPVDRVCETIIFRGSLEERLKQFLDRLDCTDGSDERACFTKSCHRMKEVSIRGREEPSQLCKDSCLDLSNNRSKCVCRQGFYNENGFSVWEPQCVDIDECSREAHTCSQICENTQGGYSCLCRSGFIKDNDGNCVAVDRRVEIFYNSNTWIYSYHVEKGTKNTVVLSGRVEYIDYDFVTDTIYWLAENHIARSNYRPGARESTVTVDYSLTMTRDCFAVDWLARNIYWISSHPLDSKRSEIKVAKLNGKYVKTLTDIDRANSIALNPGRGLLLYTSIGETAYPHVGAIFMDGRSKRIVLILPNQKPFSLALDYLSEGRFYWIDVNSKSIFYSNYRTHVKPRRVYKAPSFHVPSSLDVFENHLYWVTRDSGELIRLEKFGRSQAEILEKGLIEPRALRVKHSLKVTTRDDTMRCKDYTCSHLCLHSPYGYTCACPDNYTSILIDGRSSCKHNGETIVSD